MKIMQIFEPAMCCATGLCGVSVDPELLRISTVLNALKNKGVIVERFNLSSAPQEFVANHTVSEFLKEHGIEGLPVITLDGEIVISGRYPANEEFIKLLDIPQGYIGVKPKVIKASVKKAVVKKASGCDCSGENCC